MITPTIPAAASPSSSTPLFPPLAQWSRTEIERFRLSLGPAKAESLKAAFKKVVTGGGDGVTLSKYSEAACARTFGEILGPEVYEELQKYKGVPSGSLLIHHSHHLAAASGPPLLPPSGACSRLLCSKFLYLVALSFAACHVLCAMCHVSCVVWHVWSVLCSLVAS